MKIRILRNIIRFREYANSEIGEKRIVRTLSSLSVTLVILLAALIFG